MKKDNIRPVSADESCKVNSSSLSTELSDPLPDLAEGVRIDETAREAIRLLASGGDARIDLDPITRLNRYFAAPYPRQTRAFASSTANDISREAFAHICAALPDWERLSYARRLDNLRQRLTVAYDLPDQCEIAFAASGTDLEYIALALAVGQAAGGVHNILLGADEVGSGCIQSAHGRYFAERTARGIETKPGVMVAGLDNVTLVDVPVRCIEGKARSSAEIYAAIAAECELAKAADATILLHIVHGSKTGLILPALEEIDALLANYGDRIIPVVDACQARITSPALAQYLARGAIIFLTGSKFMGGPPFSGFALIPQALIHRAKPLPIGLDDVLRRAELPEIWPDREILADESNVGLSLRLEASVFELERFQEIPLEQFDALVDAFEGAVHEEICKPLGISLVETSGEPVNRAHHALEMRTLATLDLSGMRPGLTFEDATALHRKLALSGVRLGQPVKAVRMQQGNWGATMRIGLSMPQMSRWANYARDDAHRAITNELKAVRTAIETALGAHYPQLADTL